MAAKIRTMTNDTLAGIAKKVGAEHGYEEATAEFAPFRDFKVKWTRNSRWISFEVSDYLADASEDVIASLLATIFERIAGDPGSGYRDDVIAHITSEEFVRIHQPIYLRRYRGLWEDIDGRLAGSYDRLVRSGLIGNDPGIALKWTNDRGCTVGRSSVLMKVVTINSRLENVPEDLLDYAVYTQVAHVSMGFNPGMRDASEYESMLDEYPGRHAMEEALAEVGLHI